MSINNLVNREVSMDFIRSSFKYEKENGPFREMMETVICRIDRFFSHKEVSAAMFVYHMEKILETIEKFQKKDYRGYEEQGSIQREVGIPDSLFKYKTDFLRNGIFELFKSVSGEWFELFFIDAMTLASEDYLYRRGIFEDVDDEPMNIDERCKMLEEHEEQQRIIERLGAQVSVKVVYADGRVEYY